MQSSEKGVNIQISDKAAAFIKSRRLMNPTILINLGSRSNGGEDCGGGSSACDEGNSGPPVAYVNTIIIDGGTPGADFIKVDTAAGIPVYLAKKVYDKAQKSGNTLVIDVKGLIMKKLSLTGLDLT